LDKGRPKWDGSEGVESMTNDGHEKRETCREWGSTLRPNEKTQNRRKRKNLDKYKTTDEPIRKLK